MNEISLSPFSVEFKQVAQGAVRRTVGDLERRAPMLARPTLKWLGTHCETDRPEEYFLHPNALTLLSLPWWLEQSLRGVVDTKFQSRLMEASTNLYYFARMLDDLMDGHPTEKAALPALYPFMLDFQGMFFEYFPSSNGFWAHFRRYMDETAEVTSVDSWLDTIDEQDFLKIAGRKTAAVLVPVAAVCYRYDRSDVLPAWEDYFHSFACWHQFRDDLLDWSEDAGSRTRTWLLCEAERRRLPDESVAMWMGREGFVWAGRQLAKWMAEMKQKASMLNSPELLHYLDLRENTCAAEVEFLTRSAAAWARLLEIAPSNG